MAQRSYLLESDQFNANFQQQANAAEAQAYAQAPQLAIQAYLQMQENNRRAQQNAAHVALEYGKLQELQVRTQSYVGELQVRQLRAQTQLVESRAQAELDRSRAQSEAWKAIDYKAGDIIPIGERYYRWLPSAGGRMTS